LFLLWAFYLSLVNAGQEFFAFQWDSLLLEAGFLAIFAAAPVLRPQQAGHAHFHRGIRLLLGWLLFRLVFMSGYVKLASGDDTWRNLTALYYHYETQPLPHWISWYAFHLPHAFHRFSALLLFFLELVIPFFIFTPRRTRFAGFLGIVLLQLLILLTGNYGFFNILALVLCIPLLDDSVWRRFLPEPCKPEKNKMPKISSWPRPVIRVVSILIFVLTSYQTLHAMNRGISIFPVKQISQWAGAFRSFNNYGLFAVMTTSRAEIVVEGSNDGKEWRRYIFKYKPNEPERAPKFVVPHMPRLDWQMWFAALGRAEQNPWLIQFCVRLLEGSSDVLNLLEINPFPVPPRYLRAVVYTNRFSDSAVRQTTGAWWVQERQGKYMPVISLHKQAEGV
jgi:hypothetical protein